MLPYSPAPEILHHRRNLLLAGSVSIAKWFLKANVNSFLGISIEPPMESRIDWVLLILLAYFAYTYWNAWTMDWNRWEEEQGLTGGAERKLKDEFIRRTSMVYDQVQAGDIENFTSPDILNQSTEGTRERHILTCHIVDLPREIAAIAAYSKRKTRLSFVLIPAGLTLAAVAALIADMNCLHI